MNIPLNLRRARWLSWTSFAIMAVTMLFAVTGDGPVGIAFYSGIVLSTALNYYAYQLRTEARREQRQLDREEYRRLISKQPGPPS